jgi:folylpolyglutamate synthase/dihydropteroate synthase
MLSDKDAKGYLRELSPCVEGVVTYPLSHDRAADTDSLREACRKAGVPCRVAAGFPQGFRDARKWAGAGGVMLVCGSLVTAGDAYRNRAGSVP